MAAYIPKQGDIIAITLDPQSSHERKDVALLLLLARTCSTAAQAWLLYVQLQTQSVVSPFTCLFRKTVS